MAFTILRAFAKWRARGVLEIVLEWAAQVIGKWWPGAPPPDAFKGGHKAGASLDGGKGWRRKIALPDAGAGKAPEKLAKILCKYRANVKKGKSENNMNSYCVVLSNNTVKQTCTTKQ